VGARIVGKEPKMKVNRWTLWIGCLLLAVPALASERTLVLDPDRTEVSFDLPATGHDVHGLVSLERGVLRFDAATGTLEGEVVLDPSVARTGNRSRDKTMRKDVLETGRFPSIRFLPSSFEGTLAENGTSDLVVHGELDLHGSRHPIDLPTRLTAVGDELTAEFDLEVPFIDWGMHDPSILFLRVAKIVQVHVRAQGEVDTTETLAEASSAR